MCRYTAYLGPPISLASLIYQPENSLVHQATEAMRSPTRINADGFGVGWYAPAVTPEPALFKDTSPLWNNRNLGDIANQIESPAIAAHIRAAKRWDPVTRENCHPFKRGPLLWMHNGDIPGRSRLYRQVAEVADDAQLAMIRGNTDTELALTLFLACLERPPESCAVDELAQAMQETVARISAWYRESDDGRPLELNFCVLDGTGLVATRFAISERPGPTLFWRELDGSPGAQGSGRAVLVASEPLQADDEWREVANGEMLVVTPDLAVDHRSLAA